MSRFRNKVSISDLFPSSQQRTQINIDDCIRIESTPPPFNARTVSSSRFSTVAQSTQTGNICSSPSYSGSSSSQTAGYSQSTPDDSYSSYTNRRPSLLKTQSELHEFLMEQRQTMLFQEQKATLQTISDEIKAHLGTLSRIADKLLYGRDAIPRTDSANFMSEQLESFAKHASMLPSLIDQFQQAINALHEEREANKMMVNKLSEQISGLDKHLMHIMDTLAKQPSRLEKENIAVATIPTPAVGTINTPAVGAIPTHREQDMMSCDTVNDENYDSDTTVASQPLLDRPKSPVLMAGVENKQVEDEEDSVHKPKKRKKVATATRKRARTYRPKPTFTAQDYQKLQAEFGPRQTRSRSNKNDLFITINQLLIGEGVDKHMQSQSTSSKPVVDAEAIARLKQQILEESQLDFTKLLEEAEINYAKEVNPTADQNFAYATTLIRSRVSEQKIQKGMAILRSLLGVTEDKTFKRDCLYYIAYGHYLLEDYDEARQWISVLLKIEPDNLQAAALRCLIEDKLKQDGLIGVAIVGGLVAAVGVVAYALSKK